MAETITIRTRRFRTNPLLSRKQMVVDVLHPGRSGISKSHLEEALATLYKTTAEQISILGLQTAFGGGKTTGFVCIYDSVRARTTFDAKYRLKRAGLASRGDRQSKQNRTCYSIDRLLTSHSYCCDTGLTHVPALCGYREPLEELEEEIPRYQEATVPCAICALGHNCTTLSLINYTWKTYGGEVQWGRHITGGPTRPKPECLVY